MHRQFRFLSSVVVCSLMLCSPAPLFGRELVRYSGPEAAGTIVIKTSERTLYFITGNNEAIRYRVGVGRAGMQWIGTTTVVSKRIRPAWMPPADMARGRSRSVIPGGSPRNPMGEAALVLADHELAIHGTNNPGSIGRFASWGCVRMYNSDIQHLYSRVGDGTRVVFSR